MARGRDPYATPKGKLSKESWEGVKFLFRYLRPYSVMFLFAMLALIGTTLAGLSFPALIGKLIDTITGGNSSNTFSGMNKIGVFFGKDGFGGQLDLTTITLLLLGSVVFQSFLSFIRSYLLTNISERSLTDLRRDLYGKIIRLPMDYFHRHRVGELSSRISNDVSTIQTTITFTASELIRQILTLAGGIALVAYTSPKLTVIILTAVPLVIVIAVVFGRMIRKASRKVQDLYAESNTIIEETFQGIGIVKAFTAEGRETRRYADNLKEIIKTALKAARARAFFTAFIMLALFGGIVGVVWYGGTLVLAKQMTVGELVTFVFYAIFVGGAMGSFADLWGMMQRMLGASERVREIMLKTESEDISLYSTTPIPERKGKIELQDITFAYPSRPDVVVLKGISLTVPAGSSIALVGSSGAGKTTVAGIIMRFFEPSSGKLLIDDNDATASTLTEHRSAISIVPQDVMLFGGTIAENIAYGRPEATEEEIREAASLANALQFIEEFPDGFNTIVGERGVQLSGGQRQRIAIARGVLKNPRILILDEATSFLDSESERLVQEALERVMVGRTTIIIAHRLSTVRRARNIAVMRSGEIVESGTYESLLAANGMFARLVAMQNQTGEDVLLISSSL